MKFARNCFGIGSVLLALSLVSCGKPASPGSARPDAPRTVRVVRAELRPMERTLTTVGTLSAYEETTVAAQVAGQIEKYRVDLGDQVAAGQELALIDTAAYDALARQSDANLAKAAASAANAAQNLKRVQELQKEKIASGSDLDLAVAEFQKAQAEVKAVEAADAIARLNLERSHVKAPFDGAVAERIASVGGYAAVGTPILKFVQTNPLRLRLEVPERDSTLVRAGQEIRITVEGDTNVYAGKLARVAPAIRESNRMLLAEADVPAVGGLRPGLFARVQIVIDAERAVSLPPDALIIFAGLEKAVLVADGKAVERTIKTGRRGNGWVEVVSGITVDDLVILDPAGLHTGQPVTVATPASQAAATAAGSNR